jgi:hypothetical protein
MAESRAIVRWSYKGLEQRVCIEEEVKNWSVQMFNQSKVLPLSIKILIHFRLLINMRVSFFLRGGTWTQDLMLAKQEF